MTIDTSTNALIVEAFDLIGIGNEGESISADMYARATRSLNMLIASWSAHDHLWKRSNVSIALVSGQAAYTFVTKPMRVLSARRKVTATAIEVPLNEFARQEYLDMPNKTVQSIPVSYYYDPQISTGTIYVWPTPSAATASSTTLEVDALVRMSDFATTATTMDLPDEWSLALVYNLAQELALKYSPNLSTMSLVRERAANLLAAITGWDSEPASIYLQPDRRH